MVGASSAGRGGVAPVVVRDRPGRGPPGRAGTSSRVPSRARSAVTTAASCTASGSSRCCISSPASGPARRRPAAHPHRAAGEALRVTSLSISATPADRRGSVDQVARSTSWSPIVVAQRQSSCSSRTQLRPASAVPAYRATARAAARRASSRSRVSSVRIRARDLVAHRRRAARRRGRPCCRTGRTASPRCGRPSPRSRRPTRPRPPPWRSPVEPRRAAAPSSSRSAGPVRALPRPGP